MTTPPPPGGGSATCDGGCGRGEPEPGRAASRGGVSGAVARALGGRGVLMFVGRTAELALLRAELRAARTGTARRVVVVEGPEGIGKTALVHHAIMGALMGDTGVRVLAASGEEGERQLRLGVLRRLTDEAAAQAGLDLGVTFAGKWPRFPALFGRERVCPVSDRTDPPPADGADRARALRKEWRHRGQSRLAASARGKAERQHDLSVDQKWNISANRLRSAGSPSTRTPPS
ncbi:AAA family ATPase [Nonomuraea sp. NPDC049695]|uniref:AAA family ATPase n=1 Tax=Nonomuraea sp. NPDC049695 TaxID=3154734 RepID=UPI00343684B3